MPTVPAGIGAPHSRYKVPYSLLIKGFSKVQVQYIVEVAGGTATTVVGRVRN